MAFYHVEIGYRTKRERIAVGMTVRAFNDEAAEEIARDEVLKGYPARKWAFSNVREATESDMKLGVINPAPEKQG